MRKIGLTGGIGSGKSIVAILLTVMGIPVYVADEESKRLTDTSPIIRRRLTDLLGEEIYSADKLDRKQLAACIFNNPQRLQQANDIIHPEVNRHFLQWANRQTTPLCAIETAILFESGFRHSVDLTIMVCAPLELRIERAASRDQTTRQEIIRRINAQMPDENKITLADYLIHNDGRRALIPQLTSILATINSQIS